MNCKRKAKAAVVAVGARTSTGYRWHWQPVDGGEASQRTFDLYYDCVIDARRNGYEVDFGQPPPALMDDDPARDER